MPKQPNNSSLDTVFHISLLLKAADSVLEVIGGLLILLISPESINRLVVTLTQHELSEDPHDIFANHLLKASQNFVHGGRYFAAAYLLSHGLVKIFLIVCLFKQKLWAYPTAIAVLLLFIVYQLYRLNLKFTWGLVFLTLFDILIVLLTWVEWQKTKRQLEAHT